MMAVCVLDSKSLEMKEERIYIVAKALREGRKGGIRDFCVTSDFNVELGLMCRDEDHNELLTKMYGPWAGMGTTRVQAASENHVVWGL